MSEPTPSDRYALVNHHHELTDRHVIVDFGDGEFVANVDAVPLLAALNEAGLRTRTHHYAKGDCQAFVALLLDEHVRIEVRTVEESCGRTKYNGRQELLIVWKPRTP